MSNAKKSMISSLLLIIESVGKKSVGLVSTLILARVLLPEDFGLVAICTIFIGFIRIFVQTGSELYLMRSEKIDDDMIHTSWTINFILKGLVAIVMASLAPLLASYYGDERLIDIIYVFSGAMFINLLASPGLIHLKRAQNYGKIVKLSLVSKIIAVIVAVSIALIYESYWALVLGQVSSNFVRTVGTHIIYPYRLRFGLKNAKAQWKFSGWMIPQSILGYSRTQLDTFLVSSYFGKDALGSYHIMKYLSFIPSSDIILPITKPLLVELVKIKDNKAYFAQQYNVTFIITMCLALPITAFMWFHQGLIVEILLGDNWSSYSNLFGIFSLLIPSLVMMHQGNRLLLVHANTKAFFYYELISFAILYSSLFYVGFNDLVLFSGIRVGIENLMCFIFLISATTYYISMKNALRMLLTLIPVILASYIAGLISSIYTIESYALLELVFSGVLYILAFISLIALQYLIIYKHTNEWKYIFNLTKRSLNAALKRQQA